MARLVSVRRFQEEDSLECGDIAKWEGIPTAEQLAQYPYCEWTDATGPAYAPENVPADPAHPLAWLWELVAVLFIVFFVAPPFLVWWLERVLK